jgi:hypothetical protein
VVAHDVDNDGDVDLIWVEGDDSKEAVVWMNDGEGNFLEVSDNGPYASELDWLFGGEPSGHHSLKRKHKTSTLPSSSFHDVGLPTLIRFCTPTFAFAPILTPAPLSSHLHFVPYLCKRGPPPSLS